MIAKMTTSEMHLVEYEGNDTQLCAVMTGGEKIEVKHAKILEPQEDEVRVKIKWVGTWGSDLEVFRGNREPEFVSYRTRLGHEVAGGYR